jgi:hypothetical protein
LNHPHGSKRPFVSDWQLIIEKRPFVSDWQLIEKRPLVSDTKNHGQLARLGEQQMHFK